MSITNEMFYYCYSPVLFRFLQNKGLKYICLGLNENTYKKFWQFYRTPELKQALDEFRLCKPKQEN